ncbi:SapC family protein [uncultured Thiohalocapsa sp.]|uniref:SapC family protein n=1 Tax=uncultured Thiohalocapsa sp. TaxID=768990 RepID=UPI0025E1F16A|nr:SapC family protein [uncultured Thiohalocapsa sp.]
MSAQLLFYSHAVPVNSNQHADLSVKQGGDFSFAAKVNSVPLTAVEFRPATREHVLVFAGEGENIVPVAVLGTTADENLFIGDDGAWTGDYVPAFIRRYPFVFASSDDGKTFTLCIDDSFSGCNTEGRGERLFDADGNRTQYLSTVLNFVQEYQAQFNRTRAFCAHLNELGLLEPMQATFTQPDGERRSLTGFMAVNRAKLKDLDDATLAQMAKRDELELIYLHLHSLGNFNALLKRAGATPAAAAKAEGDTAAPDDQEDAAPGLH